jgi:hypothetical protein
MKLKGKVRKVILRGELAVKEGEIYAPEGFGIDQMSGK